MRNVKKRTGRTFFSADILFPILSWYLEQMNVLESKQEQHLKIFR